MNLNPVPWVPSAKVLADLNKHSAAIMGHTVAATTLAILHGRRLTSTGQVDEVGALAWFFVHGLPHLETSWNAALEHTRVTIKGVFCHKSGNSGPVVDFIHPLPCGGGCELSDLLFIVTGQPGASSSAPGNALFLQAKAKRLPLSGDSTQKQKFLYESAPDFTFQKVSDVASSTLPENTKAGSREMPIDRSRGFKFWFYDSSRAVHLRPRFSYLHPIWQYASTTAAAGRIGFPALDEIFEFTLFNLLTGADGLGFSPPVANDFGWNRIVRDVVKASIGKALSVPKKISGHSSRVHGWSAAHLAQITANDTAVISNPFTDLGTAFGDDDLNASIEELAKAKRTKPDEEKFQDGDDGPPRRNRQEPSEDEGGGGSFIWISLSEKQG